MIILTILAALVALVVLVGIASSVKVVRQSYVGIVERLGRYQRTLQPGVHILVPFLDRQRMVVDMKETVQPFPPTPVITQDNVTIGVDTIVYYQVTDPTAAVYGVANMLLAMEQLTITTLRNVVGAMTLEGTLTSRDQINTQLRVVLDEATEKWGVRVTRVELKSIDPPRSIQEAMEQQMRADRAKRATVLQAEGEKQSAILRAGGVAAGRDPQRPGRAAGQRAASRGRPPGARAARAGRSRSAAADLRDDQNLGRRPGQRARLQVPRGLPAVAAGDANKLMRGALRRVGCDGGRRRHGRGIRDRSRRNCPSQST